ncbi:beta-propeller fold lactonase family protein [Cohnella sp. CFH 77786]|uniref:glutaminyl-peptide cyclotransferase n=1 Tax=Cohnella sp. CFH 77786 TaxID=2662265 RepID=UPI001C60F9EC|nr:glutaminyl-peptide cyclotransferase [Cohnella sp. CFH 77786]MBW5447251.1 beta-propeller fold lactonase family protein [Cohnella sp. CFH 77786]
MKRKRHDLGATAIAAVFWLLSACSSSDPVREPQPLSSDNLALAEDGTTLYTVNGDAGTVTKTDLAKGKVVSEIPVGRMPQQAVLSPDGRTLYVTCRDTDRVNIIDTRKMELKDVADVGIEPYGVVVSPDGGTLYVSNDRSGTVSFVDTATRQVTRNVAVGERPRALALAADGSKLYVGLYLSAHVIVVDTASGKVAGDIALAASPDRPDRKKSQGTPNTLEQIRISPDGRFAWVSHLLTNTDTPIQFEEAVFPAVSVLDLKADRELPEQRKQLFEEINVADAFGKTMIVSNPSDIAFAPDGKKAYVLMSGSEDIVVFDLGRGGNAIQIVRHVPGNWPIGMTLADGGAELIVHNGNTHDLATVDTGWPEGDARAVKQTLKLVAKDPLTPQERLGKTVFLSANSDEFPVTGSFWMSCVSCHAGGETDGLTLLTPKGPRNVPSNVRAMDTGLFMWDGSRDDMADYIHTVQGEMGGMEDVDPAKPMLPETRKLFDALAAYLKNPDSLPVPRSPYRTPDGQLTPEAQAGKKLFETKGKCISCHAGSELTDSGRATGAGSTLTVSDITHLYDVGTGTSKDLPSKGDARGGFANPRTPRQWDVPTLRGIWATAPYLHDGSAKALKDVLTTRNPEGKHGGELSDAEIDSVVAYLKQIE